MGASSELRGAWQRVAALGLAGLAMLAAAWFRLWAVGANYEHPDEVIAEVLLRDLAEEEHWDLNWDRSSMPPQFRAPQYNFSSYYYAAAGGEALLGHFLSGPERGAGRLERVRFQSLLCSVALVGLVIVLGWALGGPWAGALVGWLTAINPLMVQDAAYARPESFISLLVLGSLGYLAWLLRAEAPLPSRRRPWLSSIPLWCLAGSLLGLAGASKVSIWPLAVVGLLVAWVPALSRAERLRVVAAWCAGVIGGLVLGQPALVYNLPEVWAGIQALQVQYGKPAPPHCLWDGGPAVSLARDYFHAILGIGFAPLFVAGLWFLVKRLGWRVALLLSAPLWVTAALMLPKPLFFERNYSHALAPALLVVSIGGSFASPIWWARALAGLAVLSMFMAAAPTLIGIKETMDGTVSAEVLAARRRAMELAPGYGLVAVVPALRNEGKKIDDLVSRNPGGVLLEVWDGGDEWSGRMIGAMFARYRVEELFSRAGVFAHLPICTLHSYHDGNQHYLLVRPKIASAEAGNR